MAQVDYDYLIKLLLIRDNGEFLEQRNTLPSLSAFDQREI
jgi:hypothetical protein